MPGENCAIFGCPTSRRHPSISIFKVPLPNNEVNKKLVFELIFHVCEKKTMLEHANRVGVKTLMYLSANTFHFQKSSTTK